VGWRLPGSTFGHALGLSGDALRYRADRVIVHYGFCLIVRLGMLPLPGSRFSPERFNTLLAGRRPAERMCERLGVCFDRPILRHGGLGDSIHVSCHSPGKWDEITGGRQGGREMCGHDGTRSRTCRQFVREPNPFGSCMSGRIEATRGVLVALELARRFAVAGRPTYLTCARRRGAGRIANKGDRNWTFAARFHPAISHRAQLQKCTPPPTSSSCRRQPQSRGFNHGDDEARFSRRRW